MNKYENQACCFMQLICSFIADENNYMLHVNDYEELIPDKVLLGYYDNECIYLIPSVVIGMCDTVLMQNKLDRLNMREVMYQLCIKGCIKYDFERTGRINFRPKKQVGNTRKRYITIKHAADDADTRSKPNVRKLANAVAKYSCSDTNYADKCAKDAKDGIFYSLLLGEQVEIEGLGMFEVGVNSDGERIPIFKAADIFKLALNNLYCGRE